MDEGVSCIKTILFDMDGVITSELAYWKTAALTVYEIFYEGYELNRKHCYEEADQIMETVFLGNKTIETAKSLSVNSNWDLAYITVMASEILRCSDADENEIFKLIPEFLLEKSANAPELFDVLAMEYKEIFNIEDCSKEGEFFNNIKNSFQKWYLEGLIENEQPLLGLDKTVDVLSYLYNKGYTLGIGTGRPFCEIERPLENWGIKKFFDLSRIVSYDDVIKDQNIYNEGKESSISFAKPHPYSFIKGAKGAGFTLSCLENIKEDKSVLVIGDATCDFEAARAAGFKFCAVLTGVDGKDSETYFINEGADFVIDDACQLKEIL